MSTGVDNKLPFVVMVAMVVLAAGCAPSPTLGSIAAGYSQAALRLAQHDPSLVDAWRGPERLEPGPRGPVKQIAADIALLLEDAERAGIDLSSVEEQARLRYLTLQLRALRFAADRQLGEASSVDDQAKAEFDVTFPPLDEAAVQRMLGEIDTLLPGKAPLAERVREFRARINVPRERTRDVFDAAMDACKEVSASVVQLPNQEDVEVIFTRRPSLWDGFARPSGDFRTQIRINDEVPLDISRALRLACHEGYPGHHVQHVLIDQLYESRQWMELRLTPSFGRHLLLTEGAAEVAADLAFPPDRRRVLYRERLFPAATLDTGDVDMLVRLEELQRDLLPVVTDVAREYLASTITKERALERLEHEALVAAPPETLDFIERRRARALVYGEGRRIIYSLLPSRDLQGLKALMTSTAALQ